jgi:hypothetical protein
MPIAATMAWKGTDGRIDKGWTETHVHRLASTIPSAVDDAIRLMNARTQLMGQGVRADELRLSDPAVQRDSTVYFPGDYSGPNILLSAATTTAWGNCDQPNACAILRLDIGVQRRSNLFMAGVPDLLLDTTAVILNYAAVPGWLTAYNTWRGLIVDTLTGRWGTRTRALPSENPKATRRTVIKYSLATVGPAYVGAVIALADDFAVPGDLVQIRDVKVVNRGYRRPQGQWYVDARTVDTTNSTVTYFLRGTEGINIGNITKGGTIEGVVFTYAAYTASEIEGKGTRKRGIGLSRPRGRSLRRPQRV